MRRQKKGHPVVRPRHALPRHGVELVVTYRGLDTAKDEEIDKALGAYGTGSGMAFGAFTGDGMSVRDHTATVPPKDLARVLRALKKIRGVRTRRLVQKWVLCR